MVDLDNLDELIDEMKQGNAKYLLVNVIAKRVRAYGRIDTGEADSAGVYDPAAIAMEELREGKLNLIKDSHEEAAMGIHEERERDGEEEE